MAHRELSQHVAGAFLWLAAAGLAVSVAVHVAAYVNIHFVPGPALLIGIFVVWAPAILYLNRLTAGAKQADMWKVGLRGCPPWLVRLLIVTGVYVFVHFFASIAVGGKDGPDQDRVMSGHAIVFYFAAAAILHSARSVESLKQKTCQQGHAVSRVARYCEECGSEISTGTSSVG